MAVAYNSANNVTVAYASAAAVNLAAMARAAGDFLHVALWIENTTKAPTTPAGWTAEGSIESVPKEGVNPVEVFFYVRKADNTATDNFASTWTGASPRLAVMRRVTGALGYVAGVVNSGGSAKPVWKSAVVPASKSAIGLGLHVAAQPSELTGPPAGWTDDKGEYPAISKALAAGATGDVEGTYSESEQWMTRLFAFYEEEEKEEPPVAVPGLDARVIREPPPTTARLALSVRTPDGAVRRWADDEPGVENIPNDLTKSSSVPGGDADLSCGLLRDMADRASDLDNNNEVKLYGPGVEPVWSGYLTKTPGSSKQVTPAAVGDVGRLKDDPSLRMIPVDRDLSHWRGPTHARKIELIAANQPAAAEPQVAPGDSGQVLRLELNDSWSAPFTPRVEAFYNQGEGLNVGRVYSKTATNLAAPWVLERYYGGGALIGSPVNGAVDDAIAPAGGGPEAAFVIHYNVTPAGIQGAQYVFSLEQLAVYGIDVPVTANPAGGPHGVLGDDVLKAVLDRVGNGVIFDPLQALGDGFVIPHLVWLEAVTGEQAILDVNRFYRNLWGVYNKRLRWAPPEQFGRLWHVRRDEGADLQLNGPDTEQEFNGLIVQYDDALTGTRRLVGPPASGYKGPSGLSTANLVDLDPYLPLNRWGRRRWLKIDAGLTSEAGAIRIGELAIAQLAARKSSGSIEIGHFQVFDATGARYPAWSPNGGDRIIVDDEANAEERLIIEAPYTHASGSASLTLDSPPDALEAIQERLQVVLVGVES